MVVSWLEKGGCGSGEEVAFSPAWESDRTEVVCCRGEVCGGRGGTVASGGGALEGVAGWVEEWEECIVSMMGPLAIFVLMMTSDVKSASDSCDTWICSMMIF